MLNTQGLSLDQAPPISVPFRFFLSAPVYAAAAGLLLLLDGPDILASRWTPASLALTHLITLGFLGHVMVGAMMQLMPVLAGARVPVASQASTGIHILLSGGTLMLVAGFLGLGRYSLLLGAVGLCLAFGLFLVVAGIALTRAQGAPDTVRAMRLGLTALLPTAGLGLYLVLGIGGWWPVQNLPVKVDLHLTWGLLGWVGLLLVGILAELVPMFYVAPAFPAPLRRWLSPSIFLLLVIWSLAALLSTGKASAAIGVAAAGFTAAALVILWLTRQRKRPIYDATLFFIWAGCVSMLAAAFAWAFSADAVMVGILLLGGVSLAFPSGMLNKIVPFLCWFHLQGVLLSSGRFDRTVPSMKGYIPENRARWQLWLYLAALVSLLVGYWWPEPWARVGGMLLSFAFLMLFVNLAAAVRLYRTELTEIQNNSVRDLSASV